MEQTKQEKIDNLQPKSNRNGLIELYRFLFAMWVVWYHGFFLFQNEYFDHGYIAVEFFFILSGFYILKTIDKYKDEKFFAGLGKLLWGRIKSLGLAFIIGVIFSVWFMVIDKKITKLGFLWYIPYMLLAFIVVYTLKRLIRQKWVFLFVMLGIAVVCYLLQYIPIYPGHEIIRSLEGVSLGVVFSLVPKVHFRVKRFDFNWIIALSLFGLTIYLAYLPKSNSISECLLVGIIMPLLVYFTDTLEINCTALSFLGSLSFGLYAYQCVLRVLICYISLERYWLFLILIALVFLDKIFMFAFKKYKNKKCAAHAA